MKQRSGLRAQGSTALAAILFAVCAMGLLPTSAAAQQRYGRRVDSTFAFGRNGWVDVNVTSGTIIITGWTRPEARVMGRADNGIIEAEFTNNRIAINVRPERNTRDRKVRNIEIEINVPVGTRVLATASGGDIRVRGTQAEVQASTAGGDIEVVDAADRISVQSVGGDIRVDKARGSTTVGTTGGDIELNEIVGPLSIKSVSSELVLRRIESSDVRIQTTSGDVTYEGTVDPKGNYEINAHSGDVRFALPTGTGASLSLQTYNGDIHSAFPMTLMPGSKLQRRRDQRMEFDVGGGGARIRIETFSGEITISRGSPRRIQPE